MIAFENRRPTFARSGSLTVTRSSAVAVSGSTELSRTSLAANESRPPSNAHSIVSARAARSAIASPVNTIVIELRKPPA